MSTALVQSFVTCPLPPISRAKDGGSLGQTLQDGLLTWCHVTGVPPEAITGRGRSFSEWVVSPTGRRLSLREPRTASEIRDWEFRYGHALPRTLRAWFRISDGLYLDDQPLIHPLGSLGPMILFSRLPGLWVQPESWFELGCPGDETICIDLAYQHPAGGCPIFGSGDERADQKPMIVASSFEQWLITVLRHRGRPYWRDPGFEGLGDPWAAHRRFVPTPRLPGRLADLVEAFDRHGVDPDDFDERSWMRRLSIGRRDMETILRYLQHVGRFDRTRGRILETNRPHA